MDIEFEKVKVKVGLMGVNIIASRYHAAEIERQIRLMK